MTKIIYTNNAESEIWTLLGLFESKKYVKNAIIKRNPDIHNDELQLRINEITYSVRQAKEFFKSSKEVTILTSPLLLSYGMLNLGKALVYFKSSIETDFSTYFKKHGANVPIDVKVNSLSEEYVELQSFGAYRQISEIYGDKDIPKIKISLKDLLGQVPDLKELYEYIFYDSPRVYPLNKIEYGFSIKDFGDNSSNIMTKIKDAIELFKEGVYCIDSSNTSIIISKMAASEKTLRELKLSFLSTSGVEYLRIPLRINDKVIDLTDLSIYYLIIFSYGMLARYQASKWGKYTDPDLSKETEIITKSIRICGSRYLHLVINSLFDEEFIFKESVEGITESRSELADYVYDEIKERLENDLRRNARINGR